MKTGTLNGRPVELREVMIGVALEAQQLDNPYMSALHVLAASAHWADTGERVFGSRVEILEKWGMSKLREINALATVAGQVNLPDAVPATTNGTGEELHPSS